MRFAFSKTKYITLTFFQVFNSVNIDVVCNLLAKQALDVALRTGLHAARARLQQVCVDVLRASRGGGYGSYGGGPQQSQQGANIPVAVQVSYPAFISFIPILTI
jgi:protein transport protein SEC24